jgi:FMN phosphatase YigB (HAD superfamily)
MSGELLPLCVDLDDTLIEGDTFYKTIFRALAEKPQLIPAMLLQFLKGGRPAAKAWLAQHFPIDPATLTYRTELVDYLREQKAKGRKLYLVSATNQAIAQRIADHLGLFDGAYGSSDKHNLKGTAKADFIIKNISPRFVYAGDSFADIAVWNKAEGIIVVGDKAKTILAVLRREAEWSPPPRRYDAAAP